MPAPSYESLAQRFRPIFERIAAGSIRRDHERLLAHDAVRWLREAGFGALRVPIAQGGLGASFEQLYDLLIELGEADANLPQILRAHFAFIERLYFEVDPARHAPWLGRVAAGAIIGNASTERGDQPLGHRATSLRRDGQGWRLNGEKFYSTGTLYADWVAVSASVEDVPSDTRQTLALVPVDAQGVTCLDDWNGFGQRLTASGTTRFDDVAVDAQHVISYARDVPTPLTTVFQLFHLAALAGIARAIERDAAAFVRGRRRVFSHAKAGTQAEDPLVQQVVGRLSAAAFTATASVQAVARALDEADRLRMRDGQAPAELLTEIELLCARAQVGVIDGVLEAATRLFDVGGASALLEDHRLDRHWRNARTLASHNPAMYKARLVGDHAINGTPPSFYWSVGTRAA